MKKKLIYKIIYAESDLKAKLVKFKNKINNLKILSKRKFIYLKN